MKRIAALLLTALLILPLTACAAGNQPAPAAGNDRSDDPARQGFDPETDYDNRYAALIDCAMVDTEEAYYFYANGYIMYYDKLMEDSGFLCSKPECVHDEKFNNPDCVARANMQLPSLTYYEGKLWWVGYPDTRHIGIFRMDLDGTGKELLHSFEAFGDDAPFKGMMLWYFHRGRLFWSSLKQEISGGVPFDTAEFGYMSLEDFEPHILCERHSIFGLQPTMRFAGDSAYMFVNYDGIGPGDAEIPDPDYDEAGFIEWRDTVVMTDEVLRWDPTMDEPETVYISNEKSCLNSFNNAYVSQDGVIWFSESVLEDPDKEWEKGENDYICYINRVDANGKAERIMELTSEDGEHYYMVNMANGLILALCTDWVDKSNVIRGVWLLTFEGETLYRGELPMQYREKYEDRVRTDEKGRTVTIRHGLNGGIYNCWATRNEILFCFTETYYKDSETHGDSRYYDFVKYEITPNGLVEVPLGSCARHYSDEGW